MRYHTSPTKVEIVSELLRLKPTLNKKRSYLFSLPLKELNRILNEIKERKK